MLSTHPERDVVLQLLADGPLGRHVLVVSLGLRLLHILLLPLVHSGLQYTILNSRVVDGTLQSFRVPAQRRLSPS